MENETDLTPDEILAIADTVKPTEADTVKLTGRY